jgi:hypothetical protein
VIGALLLGIPSGIGYPLLFGFVFAESVGALVPGETALIVAAALAGNGKLSLPIVIALAALGAVLGDNLGYVIGRTALRRLLAQRLRERNSGVPGWTYIRRGLFLSSVFEPASWSKFALVHVLEHPVGADGRPNAPRTSTGAARFSGFGVGASLIGYEGSKGFSTAGGSCGLGRSSNEW